MAPNQLENEVSYHNFKTTYQLGEMVKFKVDKSPIKQRPSPKRSHKMALTISKSQNHQIALPELDRIKCIDLTMLQLQKQMELEAITKFKKHQAKIIEKIDNNEYGYYTINYTSQYQDWTPFGRRVEPLHNDMDALPLTVYSTSNIVGYHKHGRNANKWQPKQVEKMAASLKQNDLERLLLRKLL